MSKSKRKRKLCKKLSPEMKKLVWAPIKSNAGMGWTTKYKYHTYDDGGTVTPTLPLDKYPGT